MIRGCWGSYFNSRTMLTRTVYLRKCTAVHLESTPGEVTRIRYPVDRITYLENFLCQTNKPSVLFEISYLLLFPSGDNSVPHTQINTNYHINRKKMFHFKTYRLFMFWFFTSAQIPPGGIWGTSLFSRERIAGNEWSSLGNRSSRILSTQGWHVSNYLGADVRDSRPSQGLLICMLAILTGESRMGCLSTTWIFDFSTHPPV